MHIDKPAALYDEIFLGKVNTAPVVSRNMKIF